MPIVSEIKQELRGLIAQNKIDRFFKRLESELDDTSDQGDSLLMLKAQWSDLKQKEMMNLMSHQDMGVRRAQIVSSCLNLIGDLEADDLASNTSSGVDSSSVATSNDGDLIALLEEKLTFLRKEKIMAVDANAKFALGKQISEIEAQIASLK